MDAIELLKEVENARARLTLINADIETKRKEIMAPVSGALQDLEEEYQPMLDTVNAYLQDSEARLKAAIISEGASVKGEWLHALYVKGRETWDGKALSGYSAAHPEILAFKKTGEPTVTIRTAK